MATLENVEKLRERAHVSYEDANTALDATNDDLLEAVLWLERRGKMNPPPNNSGFYSTQWQPPAPNSAVTRVNTAKPKDSGFADAMKRFWNWIKRTLHKGNTTLMTAQKDGAPTLQISSTVLIIFLLFAFWVILPLLLLGLFCGYRFSFQGFEPTKQGTDINRQINKVMDVASSTAEGIKTNIQNSINVEEIKTNIQNSVNANESKQEE